MTKRIDGRAADELRPFRIVPGYTKYAEGSVLVEAGDTRVLCTVSFEDRVPYWLRGTGQGWITAEYGMLPRATCTRNQREASRGKQGGRTLEIQRLIGRSLRAVADIHKLADYTVWVDCDVIQADGGTRTASVTGAFVALALALDKLTLQKGWDKLPLGDFVAGISVVPVRLLADGQVVIQLLEIPFQSVLECPGAEPGDVLQKHDFQVEGFSLSPIQLLNGDMCTFRLHLILKVVVKTCVVVGRETILRVDAARPFC